MQESRLTKAALAAHREASAAQGSTAVHLAVSRSLEDGIGGDESEKFPSVSQELASPLNRRKLGNDVIRRIIAAAAGAGSEYSSSSTDDEQSFESSDSSEESDFLLAARSRRSTATTTVRPGLVVGSQRFCYQQLTFGL